MWVMLVLKMIINQGQPLLISRQPSALPTKGKKMHIKVIEIVKKDNLKSRETDMWGPPGLWKLIFFLLQ